MLMADGTSVPLNAVMKAWRCIENNSGHHFDRPFRLQPGGELVQPCRDPLQLSMFYRSNRARGADMFPFFRVMYKMDNSDKWVLASLTVHFILAALMSHYDRPETPSRAVVVASLDVGAVAIQFKRRADSSRVIAFEMVARTDPRLHLGNARIQFLDHAILRSLDMNYVFPTIDVSPREEPCPICMQNVPLNVEFSGCGHRIHDECLTKMNPQVCYMCRTPFYIAGVE